MVLDGTHCFLVPVLGTTCSNLQSWDWHFLGAWVHFCQGVSYTSFVWIRNQGPGLHKSVDSLLRLPA